MLRGSACQRSGSFASSIDVPAASCSASTTSASAPACAFSSCVHLSMRCSASSSFAAAASFACFGASSRKRGQLAEQRGQRVGRRRRLLGKPVGERMLEARARALLLVLAIETSLERLASGLGAQVAFLVVGKAQRLPAAIELDHRREDRPGPRGERLELGQDGIRFGGLAVPVDDGVDPLPREPRHAAILLSGNVGDPAQSLRRLHAIRGRLARLGVLRGDRQLDERGFVADRRDRGAATIRIGRTARDIGADRVGARVGFEERGGERGVGRLAKLRAERFGDCRTDARRSVSAAHAAISATPSVQRLAAARRTSGEGSPASRDASSSESAGNAATPSTRRAGSASRCAAERNSLPTMDDQGAASARIPFA